MEHPEVVGHYQTGAIPAFSVVERDGRLFIVQPPIPDEYNPELEWVGRTQLRMTSGPAAGALIDLEVQDGVTTGGTIYGALPFSRTDIPPDPTPGEGLRAPLQTLDPDRDALFDTKWSSHVLGEELVVPAPYQIHEFVTWLMGRDEYIFHGSKKTDVEVFEPRRGTVELMDYGGHGNLGAVYGTHDGLWAMFFAIVDRGRVVGSIRNGVATYRSSMTGEEVDLYQFSVSSVSLPDRPFSAGALYVLPRDTFERIPIGPDGPHTNEWGSPVPVTPLAVVMVQPEDFPFLDDIGGHDDGELIRLGELSDHVYGNLESAERIEGGFRLRLSTDADPGTVEDWLELGRRFFPDVARERVGEATVEIRAPDAVLHVLEDRLAQHLEG